MTQWTLLLFSTAFLALSTAAKSQCCPFDNAAIIVVTVHEKDSTKNIPHLRITIVDSLGNPITETTYKDGQPVVDTLRFWQNPNKTTFVGYIDNENPADPTRINFPFAKDNYVFVCGHNFSTKNYRIKIEEIDGKANGVYSPLHWTVPLYDQDKYSLCETFDDLEYSPLYYGTRLYKPIEIIMGRKK